MACLMACLSTGCLQLTKPGQAQPLYHCGVGQQAPVEAVPVPNSTSLGPLALRVKTHADIVHPARDHASPVCGA